MKIKQISTSGKYFGSTVKLTIRYVSLYYFSSGVTVTV